MLRRMNWKLHSWKQSIIAVCIGLGLLLISCAWLDGQQEQLASKMIRLHVLANSDTTEDQTLKLAVRDAVIEQIEPWIDENDDVTSAQTILQEKSEEIKQNAQNLIQQQGYDYPVKVALENTWFPTRNYEGFSLPAGQYDSLRVIIGEGEGHNWWCVLFPPLCVASSTESVKETAKQMGLTDQEVFLIMEESEEYEIKFKAIEWWETMKHKSVRT